MSAREYFSTTWNSALNDNSTDKFITLAVDSFSVCNHTTDVILEDVYKCHHLPLRIGLFLGALLVLPGYRLRLRIYPDENYDEIFHDLRDGKVDAFPFEITMPTDIENHSYYWTSPVQTSGYYMYSGIRGITDSMDESPIMFLTSPFTREVWIYVGVSAACVFFIAPFLIRQNHQYSFTQNSFMIVTFAYAFLATVYSSHLKALLALQATSVPFNDLYDLAHKIQAESKRIIVEDRRTLRWEIFTKPDAFRTSPMQAVYDAVQRRGEDSALLLEPNMTRVCNLLDSSPEYIFFGYESIVYASCGRMCFWKYKVIENPEIPVTIPVSRRSPVFKFADLMVHALENYRYILIRRDIGGECIMDKVEKELIGMRSLSGAFALLGIGLGLSILAAVIELLFSKRNCVEI